MDALRLPRHPLVSKKQMVRKNDHYLSLVRPSHASMDGATYSHPRRAIFLIAVLRHRCDGRAFHLVPVVRDEPGYIRPWDRVPVYLGEFYPLIAPFPLPPLFFFFFFFPPPPVSDRRCRPRSASAEAFGSYPETLPQLWPGKAEGRYDYTTRCHSLVRSSRWSRRFRRLPGRDSPVHRPRVCTWVGDRMRRLGKDIRN